MPNSARRRTENQQSGHRDREATDSKSVIALQHFCGQPRSRNSTPTSNVHLTLDKNNWLQQDAKCTLSQTRLANNSFAIAHHPITCAARPGYEECRTQQF